MNRLRGVCFASFKGAYCVFICSPLTHWPLGDLNEILEIQFSIDISDWWLRHLLWTYPIWMSLDFTDGQSTLVPVMAWCRQATSHYLSQCWQRSLSPYGVTRPQWVLINNSSRPSDANMCQQTIPSMVQIMACRFFADKHLSDPMMAYYHFVPEQHISMKFRFKL